MDLNSLRNFVQQRKFSEFRTFTIGDFRQENRVLPFNRCASKIFTFMCKAEAPIVMTGEKITFTRSKTNVPFYFEDQQIKKEFGYSKGDCFDVVHNICPNYSLLLNSGLEDKISFCESRLKYASDDKQKIFYTDIITCCKDILALVEKYRIASLEAGNIDVADILNRVPRQAARTFHEALQVVRIISFCFYLIDNYQIGFGRMDQYLYPFYQHDIENKTITRAQAYELLKEFFITLNKDTDLYRGVQQGDNGQSLMLGGCTPQGECAINDLTYLILEVSKDLKLIDPKINLRIDANTPDDLLKLGCELTKEGLGFPQYSNDEVVIPALVKKGYSLEDARDYTVAACWEFIIPGKGMDVVNQGAVSFPAAVESALNTEIKSGSFDKHRFECSLRSSIDNQVNAILTKRNIRLLPSPLISIVMDGALEAGVDSVISAKYHNVGIHGAGISNAVDAICVIHSVLENQGFKGLQELYKQKNSNFTDEYVRQNLLDNYEKLGNNGDFSNATMKSLFDIFADVADKYSTEKRKVRPGSGSAQFYIWLVDKPNEWVFEPEISASIDGRRKHDPLAASLAPSHEVKINGLISVLKTFSNINYSRIMNGGPITIELSPSVFSTENGVEKLTSLIKYFVKLKNQQLQLNVLDFKVLEDAMKHPERHKNLIVRVWGWSGYFCELAKEYQLQILKRHKYEI